MRLSSVLRRTSRKGPGSWSEPAFVGLRNNNERPRSPASPSPPASGTSRRKGVGRSPQSSSNSSSSRSAAGASSAAFYDGADNSYQYSSAQGMDSGYGSATHPSRYSWKADPYFNRPPPQVDFTQTSLRGNDPGTLHRDARRVADAAPPVGDGANTAQSPPLDSDGSSAKGPGTNWLGGKRGSAMPDSLERATMQQAFGSGDFSLVDREKVSVTRLLRLLFDATLKPRDADSRAFGGDNATRKAEQREELKTMDQRIVPYQHEDLMNDYLKNVDRLHTPSGAICQREVLKGRLVGLLFFTESERSLTFMRRLQVFHKKHNPDFVVVAISMGGKEMMDVSRSYGFFHCAHRDGATWVSRDAGLMIRPLVPLPRLVVVDGTTGSPITRSGVTAVMANPDTCFQAWRQEESGHNVWDYWHTMYM